MKLKAVWISVLFLVSIAFPFIALSNTSTALTSADDYRLWVQPYLSQLNGVRAVLMHPYSSGGYGFDPGTGLVRGGNIEPNAAIGVSSGYNDVIVAIDNNLEGSYSLDYFNSLAGVSTNVYGNVRALLAKTWDGIGGCPSPFIKYSYPGSFQLLDRREAEYGLIDPYVSTLKSPGNHLGGIGSNCGISGQTWFLPGYENPNSMMIVTVFPSSQPIASGGNLEELSFYIDQAYLQCISHTAQCSNWQSAYLNAMSQYPFSAPRQALHFIQASRATQAWLDSNMTYNGISAYSMLQNTINNLWAKGLGSDGGLKQTFGTGGDKTPEPNFQAMVAFDPRMPNWFVSGASSGTVSTSSSTSTSHSTTSTITSTSQSLTTITKTSTSISTSTSTSHSTTSQSSTSTQTSTTTSTTTITSFSSTIIF